MDRRTFIGTLAGSLLVAPLDAGAQPARKVYRLGILVNTREVLRTSWDEFFRELRDRGYVEGQNLSIEWRYSEGDAERWPELATELVGLKVDAIVVNTTPAALAAEKITSTIPIIITTAIDPVGAGLAASLARPGGNVTGIGLLVPELSAKALVLLKEAVPRVTRVAVLWNAANPALAAVWRDLEASASATGLVLHSQQVRGLQDFEPAFVAIAQERPDGLFVVADALLNQYRSQIVAFATHEHLPVVSASREFAELGGLISYGANIPDMFRKAANYVDKVLKGAKPADLPIEQPTKFELIINLKTAKALGLMIPQSLLLRADEVIQ